MTKFLLALNLLASSLAMAEKPPTCKAPSNGQAYQVKGMHCAACSRSIGQFFKEKPEVANVAADFKTGCMIMEWKDAKKPLPKTAVAEGLKELGYELAPSP